LDISLLDDPRPEFKVPSNKIGERLWRDRASMDSSATIAAHAAIVIL
jgi:hypothetical protein